MARDEGTPEADRLDGVAHPREADALIGQDAAESAFLDAYRGGRFPHAWILGGPEGVGKATFAYRAARFVLAHPDPTSAAVARAASLAVPHDHPSAQRVRAQAHTSLFVVRRQVSADKATMPTRIPVDLVRKAVTSFFGSTAGEGGWRVCIVDHAEDLNVQGANALLKMVEEPPPRCLFLIVSHLPGRLLPHARRLFLSAKGSASATLEAPLHSVPLRPGCATRDEVRVPPAQSALPRASPPAAAVRRRPRRRGGRATPCSAPHASSARRQASSRLGV